MSSWPKDNISFPDLAELKIKIPRDPPIVPQNSKVKEMDKFWEEFVNSLVQPYSKKEKNMEGEYSLCSETHFKEVLNKAVDQVFQGKGAQRHGHKLPLENQPWRAITENVGTGFVLGQAMKKLMELRAFQDVEAWKREAYGAIAYIVFAIMFVEKEGKV